MRLRHAVLGTVKSSFVRSGHEAAVLSRGMTSVVTSVMSARNVGCSTAGLAGGPGAWAESITPAVEHRKGKNERMQAL